MRTHLSAVAHSELPEGAYVIDEQVHEAELVREAHQDEEAGRVQGHTVRLLLELLIQLQSTEVNRQHHHLAGTIMMKMVLMMVMMIKMITYTVDLLHSSQKSEYIFTTVILTCFFLH